MVEAGWWITDSRPQRWPLKDRRVEAPKDGSRKAVSRRFNDECRCGERYVGEDGFAEGRWVERRTASKTKRFAWSQANLQAIVNGVTALCNELAVPALGHSQTWWVGGQTVA